VNRGCLLAIAVVVAFWIAVALFVGAVLATPRPAQQTTTGFRAEITVGRTGASSALVVRDAPKYSTVAAGTAVMPPSITGQATWYSWHPGQAAAGPGLRAWLGKGWRGTTVQVCAKTCISTRLTDWCACKGERIIDLDSRSFRALAPLSQGIVPVTVSRLPVGPATDVGGTP